MIAQSIEYINQRRYSRYPFLDRSTMKADNGTPIPSDFIVDAMLYPIDLVNELYLSSVDYATKQLIFSDTVTGKVHCIGTWDSDSDTVYLYDSDENARMVGIAVMGESRNTTSTGGLLEFSAAATKLTATAYHSLNQPGVRGIVLESGELFTGAVAFQGRNGVTVATYVDTDGNSIIEINVEGAPDPVEPCYDCGIIKSVSVTGDCSMLVAAESRDNTMALTTPFPLANICGSTNLNLPSGNIASDTGNFKLPSYRPDPCVDPDTPDDINCVISSPFSIVPVNGRIYIVAPSTPDYDNPLKISAREDPAPSPDISAIKTDKSLSMANRELLLDNMFDTSKLTRGKITIGYRGRSPGVTQ